MSEQEKQTGVHGGVPEHQDHPPTDPTYWYQKRHEEKQRKSESKTETPEEGAPATPVVPTDDFITREEFAQAQKERKVLEYVRQNPEFQPYVDKVLKYWNHPSRQQLPVESAFADAIGIQDLMKLGAEKAQREAQEAEKTRVGGGVAVQEGSPSVKSVFEMTDEEFQSYKAERLKS